MKTIHLLETKIPKAAEPICIEAVGIAKHLIHKIDQDTFNHKSKDFLKQILTINQENLPTPSFDAYNHYNFPDDPSKQDDVIKDMTSTLDLEKFGTEMSTNPENLEIYIATLLLYAVYSLQKIEEQELSDNSVSNYQNFIVTVNVYIDQISSLIMFAKTLAPATELNIIKMKRKAGAKKGGQRKQQSKAPLKELVLEKARDIYSHLDPTNAGRKLSEELDSIWLNNDEGMPHLKNYPRTFTSWIKKDRENNKTE